MPRVSKGSSLSQPAAAETDGTRPDQSQIPWRAEAQPIGATLLTQPCIADPAEVPKALSGITHDHTGEFIAPDIPVQSHIEAGSLPPARHIVVPASLPQPPVLVVMDPDADACIELPWSVKQAFRTKVFALAFVQTCCVLTGTIACDSLVDNDTQEASYAFVIFGLAGLAGMVLFKFTEKWAPMNYIWLAFTTVCATGFWPLADVGIFEDWADVPAQMLGIMSVVWLCSLCFAQLRQPVNEKGLVATSMLLGWVIGTSINTVVLWLRDVDLSAAVVASVATFGLTSTILLCARRYLVRCNPDDYMIACIYMSASLFMVLSLPFVIGMCFCSGGLMVVQADTDEERTINKEVEQVMAELGQRERRPSEDFGERLTDEQFEELYEEIRKQGPFGRIGS